MDDFKWFVGFLLVIGLVWLTGKQRDSERAREPDRAQDAQTETAPAPKQQKPAATYKETGVHPPQGTIMSEAVREEPQDPDISPLQGKLRIVSVNRGAFDKEYVLIQASSKNEEAVPVTGLRIRSGVSLIEHALGHGWALYFPGIQGGSEPILLRPGARAYIISGRSPLLGSFSKSNQGSFQLNLCTGYLEQGYDFYPKLPRTCPRPTDDPLPLPPNELSDDCYDYLKKIKRCTVPSSVPEHLQRDGSCQAFVFNRINYNQCVTNYKDSPNFSTGEWRIYLARSNDLWRDKRREVIELYDAEGRLIDAKAY